MKYLMGVFALIAVLGLQSFQKAQNNKKATDPEEMVWFPLINDQENQEECGPDIFKTSEGTTVTPDGCTPEKEFCCAIGYPISDCQEIAQGVYELIPEPKHVGEVIKRDE